jgi:chromosome partitioning protein
MGKIVAIANQKGGVGKTTTCTSLCCALKNRGRRVLLVDADPQGNSTSGMGVDKSASPNIYDILVQGAEAVNAVVETKYGDVIPANKELSGAAVELVEAEEREFVLKKALAPLKDIYDYIFVDCPPSLELLTVNALVAADTVLVPVQCEYYALEGIADLTTTIRRVNQRLNPDLKIEGIVLTMYDSRTNFSNQVAEEIRKYFGDQVYKTMIPRNVRLAEAPSHGKPVIAYDRFSKGSRAYLKLANEFLKRQKEV